MPAEYNASLVDRNKVRAEDLAVHDWYRFVLSFPPHLVKFYIDKFGIHTGHTVLDPFCGTGTTLVECKKLGIASVGIEANPMGHFASAVKVDWTVDPYRLSEFAREVDVSVRTILEHQGIDELNGLPLFAPPDPRPIRLWGLQPRQSKLLLKDSISPLPLHKTLILLNEIDRCDDSQLRRYGRLALAKALVGRIGNLKFGPEVGVGKIKNDVPVLDEWRTCVSNMIRDVSTVKDKTPVPAQVIQGDSRAVDQILKARTINAVITSPPYPNEKDYTRTTRLESVILGMVRDKAELRSLKQGLIRSNTRGVYKQDTDDQDVASNPEVQEIAKTIENRRLELGKTSGFERLYPRVTRLYFGGISRHLGSLQSVLSPGAKLAYVVGDQASYLRVKIPTGQIIGDIARSLGYEVTGIDLFRTRTSTVTGEALREEVILLQWSGR